MNDVEVKALKATGIMQEKDRALFTVRLASVGGNMETAVLRKILDLADRFGRGIVHLTMRQGVEIPYVPVERLGELREAITTAGLELGAAGPNVRTITACPGITCKSGLIDTQALAQTLSHHVRRQPELPHKFKIGISGCPNSCTKPRENDLGVMGQGPGTFTIFVGGKMGRTPRLGDLAGITVAGEEQLVKVVDVVLAWYRANGKPKERFGTTIDRLGLKPLVDHLRQALT